MALAGEIRLSRVALICRLFFVFRPASGRVFASSRNFLDCLARGIVPKGMTGIFSKLKRAVGFISILSMLATSVAACTCSHHPTENAETESSCHSHAKSSSEHHHSTADTADRGQNVSSSCCSCDQASPRVVFKQDQKQSQVKPAVTPSTSTDPRFVAISAETAIDNFRTRSFSHSILRSSTPSRAPPRPKFA